MSTLYRMGADADVATRINISEAQDNADIPASHRSDQCHDDDHGDGDEGQCQEKDHFPGQPARFCIAIV